MPKREGFKSSVEVMRDINKKYGEGTIISGKDLTDEDVPRLRTGLLSLDVALGGGFPVGQPSEIVGEFSSGKTAVAMHVVAEAQRNDPDFECLWVSAEEFYRPWAEKNGVAVDRLKLMPSNVMEDVYDTVVEFVQNRATDLVVIDSYPALIPSSEEEADIETAGVGVAARLSNKFWRKMNYAQKRSLTEKDRPCSLIIINQWRDKIGVLYGDPRTTPGGRGKEYAYHVKLDLLRTEWLTHEGERVGIRIRARTTKNKTAPPQRVAEFDFYFDDVPGHPAGTYDPVKDLVDTAIVIGAIDRPTKQTYTFGDGRWVSRAVTEAAIREDLDLQEAIRRETLRMVDPAHA